jgi:hypothetical protein
LGIEKITLKFGGKVGISGDEWGLNSLILYHQTCIGDKWGFKVWSGLSPLIPTKTLVPNKALAIFAFL